MRIALVQLLILFLVLPVFAQNANFLSISATTDVVDKKEIWNELAKEERNDVLRLHFAWGIQELELQGAKVGYLDRLSQALTDITQEQVDDFEDEALTLFTEQERESLFDSIGPYEPCNGITFLEQLQQQGNCNCSMTATNMCRGTCGPGVCRWTEDGCGFGWLRGCNSVCVGN